MLLISNIYLLLVNAVTFRREFTILFNRVAIFILLYSGILGHGTLYVTCLDNWIGIYNGLFHSTHNLDLLIFSRDLVYMFLANCVLYILVTLYKDSEEFTRADLTYFTLGGLSYCFILLGSAFLYANCGITSLDAGIDIYNDLFH